MTVNDLQRAELVLFAARQVGPKGSLEQMKAICYCIRNRVRAGWHDGNWLAVIEHAEEDAAHFIQRGVYTDLNSRPLQRLLHDIDDIYYGQPNPEGADSLEHAIGEQKFWMILGEPVTDWFRDHIIRDEANHRSCAQMGLMMFFQ